MDSHTVTREELYELVWAEPMTKVAAKFGVSGSYLTRVCEALNVPRPKQGYWAKLEYGKATKQLELPPRRPSDPRSWTKGEALPPTRSATPSMTRVSQKSSQRRSRSEHPLLVDARELFERTRNIDEGELLRPYKRMLPAILVSAAGLQRALEFANALYRGIEAGGHVVRYSRSDDNIQYFEIDPDEVPKKRERWQERYPALWRPDRATIAEIDEVLIGLVIVEMLRPTAMRYVDGKYVIDTPARSREVALGHRHSWTTERDLPCGRFRLIAYAAYPGAGWTKTWEERDGLRLSREVPSLVATLVESVPAIVESVAAAKREAERRHREWEEQQVKWKREEETKKVREAHRRSRSELNAAIRAWIYARDTSAFLDALERSAEGLPTGARRDALERVALARSFLGPLDPLARFLNWKAPEERFTPELLTADDVALLTEDDDDAAADDGGSGP